MATMRITMKQTLLGQEVRNTFHVAGADAVQANAQGIIDYFRSMWNTHLTGFLTVQWILYGASAKELDIVSNPTIEYNLTAGPLSGGNVNDVLPPQNALLVSWIALTARPNRGRTYLAGFTENHMGPLGDFLTTATTAAQAWADGMLLVSTPYPGLAMTVTRVDKATGTLVGSNVINSARTTNVAATQRSRRKGKGI